MKKIIGAAIVLIIAVLTLDLFINPSQDNNKINENAVEVKTDENQLDDVTITINDDQTDTTIGTTNDDFNPYTYDFSYTDECLGNFSVAENERYNIEKQKTEKLHFDYDDNPTCGDENVAYQLEPGEYQDAYFLASSNNLFFTYEDDSIAEVYKNGELLLPVDGILVVDNNTSSDDYEFKNTEGLLLYIGVDSYYETE